MKKIGYLATGLVIGMALTVVTPVLADTAKTISAKLNSTVKVAINGKDTKLNTRPIIYDNINYLSVGEIGRALGLSVIYNKTSDTIMIDDDNLPITQTTTATTVATPPVESGKEVQKVKIGESITKDGITVSIDKIEYVTKEEIDGIFLDKGFKVYTTVTNNSDVGISLGRMYNFGTGNLITDKQLNYLGNTIFLKVNGKLDMGELLTKGETATGFIFYSFSTDVNIKEISYLPNKEFTQSQVPMGTWTIE
ncbi:hypothetical protein [Paenibacillus macquariensis]|uniref:Copper amine oxidase-like N-terminal domain-containing protein n=1 Tax=Paenibacillus macquariensis TaxID=948756 RepID=A0ABY1K1A4_9BACL|nr:hypothetical protein [Paenibacillus macquariensis]MEC0091804.1 hypothetical protein [Paenibacillus macquariensis]OAB32284.1 hypothetical protein PMSM_16885 [Paenibacillus macquariensis subsp. macquariensis]SIR11659.1 hypothetical protein SAMN05421578_107111 [Paenibacillus macquariensis]